MVGRCAIRGGAVWLVVLAGALAACAGVAAPNPDPAPDTAPDLAAERLAALRALGADVPAAALPELTADLVHPDGRIREEAAFRLGLSRHPGTPDLLSVLRGREAAAAALGLGYNPSDEAESRLVAFAADGVPEAVEALFCHYRWRGRPAPFALPDVRLLDLATSPDATSRAALGHLARSVKDPRAVPALVRLAHDTEWEVRRAAALGLARSASRPWQPGESQQAVAALRTLARDPVDHVRVAACRALASFDAGLARAQLRAALDDPSFHVRAAGVASLRRLKDAASAEALARLAADDPSVSVRHDAAVALAELDVSRAARLIDGLLGDDAEWVRCAGAEVLAAQPGPAAVAKLVLVVERDPHIRVRETALGALEGKNGPGVEPLLLAVLVEDPDPVLVSVACGVAAANDLRSLLGAVRAVPARFHGHDGADAREGAVSALAGWEGADDGGVVAAHRDDPHPAVAFTARKALAKRGGAEKEPDPVRAGVTGAVDGSFAEPPRNPVLVLATTRGEIQLQLFAHRAPLHVRHVTALAARGHYDGLTWHRVVSDFVIQGGCPRGDGAGSAGVALPLEPTREPFRRGVLGMPRSSHPDSGGCQLFVMHSRAPHLDVHYTAFGRVTHGLDVVDLLDVDDRILSARVVGLSELP